MKENETVRIISSAKDGSKAQIVIHTTEKGRKTSETRHLIRVNGVFQDKFGNGYNLSKVLVEVAKTS